ncbi:polysaccharide biosynthesis protein [Planctomycetota bacterium]
MSSTGHLPGARDLGADESGPPDFPAILARVFQHWPSLFQKRRALILAIMALLFAVAYVLAFLARFEFDPPESEVWLCFTTLPVAVVTQTLVAVVFSLSHGWWRYVGLRDMLSIVSAVTLSSALLIMLRGGLTWFSVPRGVVLIDWAFAILLLAGARVSVRVFREGLLPVPHPFRNQRRVIVLGAGDAGEALLRELSSHAGPNGMQVVCFLDDNPAKHGCQIHRVPIVGPCSSLKAVKDRFHASLALVAMPSACGKDLRRVVAYAREADLECKTLPSMGQLVDGEVTVSQIRSFEIEDLLTRPPVKTDLAAIRAKISGRPVLVTGACGSIGSELCRQLATFAPSKLVLLDQNEGGLFWLDLDLREAQPELCERLVVSLGNITDGAFVREVMERHRPALVLHAAAYKHVPLVEQNPRQALKNNLLGTMVVAECAVAAGVETFVLISTDKAVNPAGIMGATKRRAEQYVAHLAGKGCETRFVSVRFGNVLGSSGSVVEVFNRQIARGGPVTVTDPQMTRYFMTVREAVQLVLQAAEFGEGGEVFVLDMGESIRISDLANELIRLSGLRPNEDIEVVYTGTRPGEKYAEELHSSDESLGPTRHPRIQVMRSPIVRCVDWERLREVCEGDSQPDVPEVLSLLGLSPHPTAPTEGQAGGVLLRAG